MNPPNNQVGIDTSVYQGVIDASSLYNNVAFWFIKATGGDDGLYVDSQFQHSLGGARALKFPRGFYHFGAPGNADDQADLFTNNLGAPQPGEWIILDVEAALQASSDPVGWALNWFMRVSQNLGGLPGGMLYGNVSLLRAHDWTPVFDFIGHGHLFVANPDNLPVPYDYVMQQYGQGTRPGINGAVDLDFFHEDMGTFGSYGWQPIPALAPLPEPPVPVPKPPVDPNPPEPPTPAPMPPPVPEPTKPKLPNWLIKLLKWLGIK